MHMANQRPRKLSQGAHIQTSYPRFKWENTLDKRGTTEPQREGRRQQQQQRGMQGQEQEQEHMTTHAAGS